MSHPNRIYNGDFAQNLDGWTLTGGAVHIANEGYMELGAVHLLTAGDGIGRDFSIGVGREYRIEVATKAQASAGNLALTITNDAGQAIYSTTLTVGTGWVQRVKQVGLPWGNHTLTLAFVDEPLYLDDVSIAYVVKTRCQLAELVKDRLGVLATDAGMNDMPDGENTEGDFTAAVDEGLRAVGACDPAGRPDVRYLDAGDLNACLGHVELAMLHKLHRYWVTKTDYSIGPRTEHLNQVQQSLMALTGAAVGGRPASAGRGVQVRRLIHK